MKHYTLQDLDRERGIAGERYLEFLRVPDVSVGVYVLEAGAEDPQGPHTEDEIYHVVSGRARFCAGDEDVPVAPGTVLYVEANATHRFHSIVERLVVLVVFGPAEGARRERRPTESLI